MTLILVIYVAKVKMEAAREFSINIYTEYTWFIVNKSFYMSLGLLRLLDYTIKF